MSGTQEPEWPHRDDEVPQDGPGTSDSAGALTLRCDSLGRVTSVVVAADWQRRVGADGLGAAALEAVTLAQLRVVDATLGRVERRMAALGPAAGSLPAGSAFGTGGTAARAAVGRAGDLTFADLDDLAGRVLSAASRLGPTPSGTPAAAAAVEGQSRNRRVTVRLVGGQVADVVVDSAWAGQFGRQQLSGSLLEAFTDAYGQAAQDSSPADGERAEAAQEVRLVLDRLGIQPPDLRAEEETQG